VADVVDKGMGAALLMALSRTLLRTYAVEYPDNPERVLNIANRRLITDVGSGMFVTLFYGVFDPRDGTLAYCNAGHPPPWLFRNRSMKKPETLQRTGVPLGIAEEATWEQARVTLTPDSLILIYTDGIQDAQDAQGDFFGEERMARVIRSHLHRPVGDIQDALLGEVYSFASGEPQVDDITLMILGRENS
jgi:serine phosphatase RsbU (regulator of sigma subunit)